MKLKGSLIVIIVIVVAVIYSAAYIVDETEQVVITQFGRIIGEPKKDPGLKFKIPIIQKANFFPKNLLDWDGDPGQILESLMAERDPLYREIADLAVGTDGRKVRAVAEEIVENL